MGRRVRPTAVNAALGTYKKDPKRAAARAFEPEAEGPLGDPPTWLAKDVKAAWVELSQQCYPGTTTSSHRAAFEMMCVLFATYRKDPVAFKQTTALLQAMDRFGLTPTGQVKVHQPPAARASARRGFGALRAAARG